MDNPDIPLLDCEVAASSRNPQFEAFKSMPTSRVESDLPFTQSKAIWRKGSGTRCVNQPIETVKLSGAFARQKGDTAHGSSNNPPAA